MATPQLLAGQSQIVVVDPNPDDYASTVFNAEAYDADWRFLRTAADVLRGGPWGSVHRWIVHAELPDMSGIELARQLSLRRRGVPVLIVSDSYCSQLETQVLASGVAHYGCKPLSVDWLRHWLGIMPARRRAALLTSKSAVT